MPVEIEYPADMVKKAQEFRNYVDSDRQDMVQNHYKLMRTNQCMAFSKKMLEKYSFDKPRARMTVRECFERLQNYVDSSDPDVSLPNIIHNFQTAEGMRKKDYPDWMQLVGLIHDMGKIMFLWGCEEDGQVGTAEGPQWALGGDTWVVGCKIPDSAVFSEFNKLNPDYNDDRYNTDLGIYQPNCGMENLTYAFGHDEYLYRMCIANQSTLPHEGLAMIRYHSCYPWHTGGAYRQFMNEKDHETLKAVLDFNTFDLYTKDESGLSKDSNLDDLWAYYEPLIAKYFPDPNLMW
jgi:inositol oxygenase